MNIVAIGGGEKTAVMRDALDHAVSTDVLIVPTACSTEAAYARKVGSCIRFFQELGVEPKVLHEFGVAPTRTQLAQEVGKAGLYYVIGGNMPHLMTTLFEHGSDVALEEGVTQHEKTLAGTSAGALLPFKEVLSNPSKAPAKEDWNFTYIDGLGMLRAVASAHGNQHDATPNGPRPDSRTDYMSANFPTDGPEIGISIDNDAALVIRGNTSHVARSGEGNVHLVLPYPDHTEVVPVEDDGHLTVVMNELVIPRR